MNSGNKREDLLLQNIPNECETNNNDDTHPHFDLSVDLRSRNNDFFYYSDFPFKFLLEY